MRDLVKLSFISGFLFLSMSLFSANKVQAADFSLDPNTSHIGWMFDDSSWDNKNGWYTYPGSVYHRGGDYYSDDWNKGANAQDDCGQVVRSPISGTVIYAADIGGGYGRQVIIRSNQNSDYAYRAAHLESIAVSVNQSVSMGQHIGNLGRSGGQDSCHLHSTLYKNISQSYSGSTTGLDRLRNGYSLGLDGGPNNFAVAFYNDGIGGGGVNPSPCSTFNDSGVTFFPNDNCSGDRRHFTSTGFYNLTDHNFNDAAKSMSVQSGWSARVYSDTNRGGATACITGTKWDMSKDQYENGQYMVNGGNATVSSFELFSNSSCTAPWVSPCANFSANGVTFFNQAQCSGTTKQFTSTGVYNLTDYGFNDTAKSMSVQSGWSARVYVDANKGGTSACITGTKWDMSLDKYENGSYMVSGGNGTVSSVELFNNSSCTVPWVSPCATFSANGVTFFSLAQCSGSTKQITNTGSYNLTDYGFNDTAKSMSVQSGWSARVYYDTDKGGTSACVSGTKWDMTLDKYDNGTFMVVGGTATVSSFQLFSNLTCTPPPSNCAVYSNSQITLFEGKECTGASISLATNSFVNLPTVGWNDRVKSIYVPAGISAVMFENDNHGGGGHCANMTRYDLSKDTYDTGTYIVSGAGLSTVSSIDIVSNSNCYLPDCFSYNQNGVILFDNQTCRGGRKDFSTAGFRNLGDAAVNFNDKTWSIYVKPGWSVQVYEHANRGGATFCATESKWNLSIDKYTNDTYAVRNNVATISSIEVHQNGNCSGSLQSACANYSATGAVLFNESQCSGSVQKSFPTVGFRNLTNTNINFNDAAKSMYVQPGWSVEVYENTNRGGATLCIIGTKWNMSLDKYSNGTTMVRDNIPTVSSIEVFNNTNCSGNAQSACANYSGVGVILFSESQCSGGIMKKFTTVGFRNLTSTAINFNDATKSMFVQSGWSVKVYEGTNRTGASRCLTGTMWDLNIDKYDGTTKSIGGTISSIAVYQNSTCS